MVFNQIRKLFITLDASDQATRKLKQVDAAANSTSASMQQAAENARKFRKRLVAVGFGAAILTGAMAQMVQKVAQVDRTFGRIKGASAATSAEMEKIRSKAQAIGAELPVTAKESAAAFEQLSYAGFTVQEQLASANEVVNLAIAGNLKMGDAAKSAASSLNSFKLEASEISQVTNTMAATFSNSALTITEMTKALEYVQSVAQMANQSFSEMTAALGVLADAGLRATRAGTAIERMFIELSKQSASTRKGLQKLGLTIENFETPTGDFKDLSDIIQVLGTSLEGMQGVERIKALQEVFGARGARAAALLIENTDAYIEKIGDNARAEINATIRTLSDLSEQQRKTASAVLGFTVTGEEGAARMLRKFSELNVSTEELSARIDTAFSGISTEASEILARDIESLERLQSQASQMSDAELQSQVQTEFNMGEENAEQFAQRISAGESFGALAESIKEMTTASDIAEEQMKSLWGQIEYLQGSIDSLIAKLVGGMKPALDVFFGAAKAVVDTLNSMPGVMRGVGLGMAVLNGILLLLVANYAYLATSSYLAATAITDTAVASILAKSYHLAHASAILILGGNYAQATLLIYNNTVAVVINKIQTAANTVAKYANIVATYANAAAQYVLTSAWVSGGIVAGIMATATWAATAGMYALEAASLIASAAVYVFYNTISLGLVNLIYILVGAIVALVAALAAIGEFDIGGWGSMVSDTFSMILDPVHALVDVIVFLGRLFYELGELAFIGAIWALSGAIAWSIRRIKDFAHWLGQLPIIGPAITETMNAIAYSVEKTEDAINGFNDASEYVGEKWAQLGLAIGDAIKSTFPYIRAATQEWNRFTTATNNLVGGIATLIEDGLRWMNNNLTLLETGILAVGVALVAITGPIGIAAAAIGGAAYLIYDNWSMVVGWFDGAMDRIASAIDGMSGRVGRAVTGIKTTVQDAIGDAISIIENAIAIGMARLGEFADMLGTKFPRIAEMLEKAGDYWDKLVEDIDSSVKSIISIVDSIVGIIVNVSTFLINFGKALGMLAAGIGMALYDIAQDGYNIFVDYLGRIIDKAIALVYDLGARAYEALAGFLTPIIQKTLSIIVAIWEDSVETIERYWDGFVEYVIDKWTILKKVLKAVGKGIAFVLALPFIVAYKLLQPYLDDIERIVNTVMTKITKYIDIAANLIDDSIQYITNGLMFWADVFGAIGVAIGGTILMIASVFTGFLDWMLGGIDDVVSNIEKMTEKMADMSAQEILNTLLDFGEDIVGTIAQGIKQGGYMVYDAILDEWNNLLSLMPGSDADEGPLSNLTSWGRSIIETIANGVKSAPGKIASSIKGVLKGISGSIKNSVTNIGEEIAKGIANGITNTAGAVSGAIGGAVDSAKKIGGKALGAAGNVASSIGSGMKAAGNTAKSIGSATGGPVGDVASGVGSGLQTTGKTVEKTNDLTVRFDGEVHDAQKVEEMVRKGMKDAAKEAEGMIDDGLEMASETIDESGDALNF